MSFSRPGAVDLSALGRPAADAAAPAGATWAVDATEADFQQLVVDASLRHIVVLSLWSPRAPQGAEFNATLAAVADSYGGQISLVRVDIDANPGIAQAVGAQAVPLVLGLVKGQPVPLFQSTVDEAEVRAVFDQLTQVAISNGLSGRAEPVGSAPVDTEDEPAVDPRFVAADEALANNDIDTAVTEYEKLATQHPRDDEIAERLAGVRLIKRTRGADLQSAREAAAANPADIDAQLLVADLDVSGGHADDAFARVLDLIRAADGDDRDRLRERLLELFIVVGITDPRVMSARRALATALF